MKRKREKSRNRSKTDVILVCVLGIVLLFYTLSILIVLGWGFLTSLKSRLDFFVEKNVLGLPDLTLSGAEVRFGNYLKIIKAFEFDKSAIFRYVYPQLRFFDLEGKKGNWRDI